MGSLLLGLSDSLWLLDPGSVGGEGQGKKPVKFTAWIRRQIDPLLGIAVGIAVGIGKDIC